MDLNGTVTEVGLTLTIGALPAVPALFWAEALVDYIGHSNVFIMAFTFYGLRYTGKLNYLDLGLMRVDCWNFTQIKDHFDLVYWSISAEFIFLSHRI